MRFGRRLCAVRVLMSAQRGEKSSRPSSHLTAKSPPQLSCALVNFLAFSEFGTARTCVTDNRWKLTRVHIPAFRYNLTANSHVFLPTVERISHSRLCSCRYVTSQEFSEKFVRRHRVWNFVNFRRRSVSYDPGLFNKLTGVITFCVSNEIHYKVNLRT